MKPKIKFGAIDIFIGVLLVIAITLNVWIYTRTGTKATKQPKVPIDIESSPSELSEREIADVPVVPESQPSTFEPLARETVSEMIFSAFIGSFSGGEMDG